MKYFTMNPTLNQRVTSPFGMRSTGFHYGVDFGPMTPGISGDLIFSVADGIVRIAKFNDSYGNYVVLEHNGYCSLYAHLKSMIVAVGNEIKAGVVIGEMGNTGHSTGVHLHFELRLDNYDSQFAANRISTCTDPKPYFVTEGAMMVKDNTPDPYAKEIVGKAVELGIIKGDANGDLRLHENITRQDVLVILSRLGLF